MSFRSFFLTGALALAATPAFAVPVAMDFVRSYGIDSFVGTAIDQTTGMIYERRSFQGGSVLQAYTSYGDFAIGNVAQTINMNTSTFYGTYAGVSDGKLFGRTTQQTKAYGRWDLTSGLLETQVDLNDFEPLNGQGTFDWGGYSGMNTFADASGNHYVVGREDTAPAWRISSIDASLNETFIGNVSGGTGNNQYGFAFMIGNSLFFGTDFNSGAIDRRFDVDTGLTSVVDFDLVFPSQNMYLSNFFHDAASDTLVAYNTSDRNFYEVANASGVFGVSVGVPAPGASMLVLLGTGMLALRRVRRQQRSLRTS